MNIKRKIKFGDIIKDKLTNTEGVVYKIDNNGSVTADTAFDNNNIPTAHRFSKHDKTLIHTNKVDMETAIRLQCHYAVENMEKTLRDIEDDELSKEEINILLFNNHLGNISSEI